MKAPHYLPLTQQKLDTGGSGQYIKDRHKVYLTSDQTRYIYKKVGKDNLS